MHRNSQFAYLKSVLFKTFAAVLYQYIKIKATAAGKARNASVLNGFKNDQSYELIGEKILQIDYAEKIKV